MPAGMTSIAMPYRSRPRRRLVLVACAVATVTALGILSVYVPERTGTEALVFSASAVYRALGLTLVLFVLPGVLVLAGVLSLLLPRGLRPVVRLGAQGLLWCAALASLASWSLVSVVAIVGSSLAAAKADADQELITLPRLVQAVPGVDRTRLPSLVGTDLASGHHVFLTADLDPELSAAEQVKTLGGISAVLAERQSNSLRSFVEVRTGTVAVGVSANDRYNASRLDLARRVSAATSADSTVVLWRLQDDDLINDDGQGMHVQVQSTSAAPKALAAAVVTVVRANNQRATVQAYRLPNTTTPVPFYDYPNSPTPDSAVESASVHTALP